MPARVFLLSPANCRGLRARRLLSPTAKSPIAARVRSEGAPIGELFAHMSGLYFRGKLTYARAFGTALVITPDQGLVPAEMPVSLPVLVRFAGAEIGLDNLEYRVALEQSACELAAGTSGDTQFVLLGSVASDKYLRVLAGVFGRRLVFPSAFVGRGDMSRGGLLLRAAASGQELEYVPVLGAVRRGSRPPKLEPLPR